MKADSISYPSSLLFSRALFKRLRFLDATGPEGARGGDRTTHRSDDEEVVIDEGRFVEDKE